jgi:UPF0755 protein
MTLLLLLLACIDPDAPTHPEDTESFVYEVPKGSTAGRIGPTLSENRLIPSELQWKLFLRNTDASCLKAGRFSVSRSMSMNQLLETLCGVPLSDDEPFTVVEGWRIVEIDAALASRGWIQAGEFARIATEKTVDTPFEITSPTLEGYLYPETYMVTPGAFDPEVFIERQLATFHERFLKENVDKLGGHTLHEVVVMASMLEREEPKPKNRPLVAGIIWNRIGKNWQLGIDATSRYTLDNWNDRSAFLRNLKDPDEPYNTRLRKGLPPGAIGNPTQSSLEAAIHPEATEYWFYLHDKDGNLHPARDGDGHDRNRAKYNVY